MFSDVAQTGNGHREVAGRKGKDHNHSTFTGAFCASEWAAVATLARSVHQSRLDKEKRTG